MEPRTVILRCGVTAQILWDSGSGSRPLIGVLEKNHDGNYIPISWRNDGYHLDPENTSNLDIVEGLNGKKKTRKARVQKQLGEASISATRSV